MTIDSRGDHPHSMSDEEFVRLFTRDKPVVFAFHGYPSAIHQLIYKRPEQERFHVRGYIEEGTTTTPFDMLVRNGTSRWQLALAAMHRVQGWSSAVAPVIERYAAKLDRHRTYIEEHGVDPPDVLDWRWQS
jgi:xylulose-5-phosphate/fructose-6-phosphate phosphoketolase